MIDFHNLIEKLTSGLQKGLPGHDRYLEIINEERLKSTIKPNSLTKQSSVLILIYEKDKKPHFALILRTLYEGTHGGQIGLPGGKVEETDANIESTAKRETEEEIGVTAEDIQIIGGLSEVFIPPSNFLVKPIIGYLNYTPQFIRSPYEVDEIIEVNMESFIFGPKVEIREVKTKYGDLKAPGYVINGFFVWGATALILTEFKDVFNNG